MTAGNRLLPLALLVLGCARDPEAPEARGRPCNSDAACNRLPDGGTAACGRLRLCVAGRCEAGPDAGSVLVVCDLR